MLLWSMRGTVLVQGGAYDWGMHPMWGFWGAWGSDDAFHVAVLGPGYMGVVPGIRWLISQSKESRSDSALEILRQRYARGEINKDDFEARKKDLLT